MKHLHPRNARRLPARRRTAAQRLARAEYGLPLPLQPRRPLRRLAGHPLFGGRMLLITPEVLRAYPEVFWAYMDWLMGNADRWIEDRRVGLAAISRGWVANLDCRRVRLALQWDAESRSGSAQVAAALCRCGKLGQSCGKLGHGSGTASFGCTAPCHSSTLPCR